MKPSRTILAAVIILLFVITFIPAKKISQESPLPITSSKEPPPQIEAAAGLVFDFVKETMLFAKNETKPLPLASLTKTVSALVILDLASIDDVVAAEKAGALRQEEHFTVRDLLIMVMRESSNDAMNALVKHAAKQHGIAPEDANVWFLPYMQQKAASWGLNTMVFHDPTGLDVNENTAGAYGSAKDVMSIAQRSFNSELWQFGKIESVVSKEGNIHAVHATNRLDGVLPQLVGAKTGLTDIAGGNLLVIVESPIGHPIGIVVLGSSEQGRFEDVKKLYDWIKIISS